MNLQSKPKKFRKPHWATSLLLFFVFVFALSIPSCEKPERYVKLEALEIPDADISYNYAVLKGEIIDIGSVPISDYGAVYNESGIPALGVSQELHLGPLTSKGVFQDTIKNLKKNTLYYFRVFVIVNGEEKYSQKTPKFRTKDTKEPTVSAGNITNITMTSASLPGEVPSDGGEPETVKGLCWGESPNPTIASCIDTTVNGTGKGTFTGAITGLNPGTSYYVRTYATNSKGTVYNNTDIVFKTHNLPKVTTTAVTAITNTGATSGGNVTDDGDTEVTARGICWGTASLPGIDLTTKTTDGSGKGTFVSTITGLTPLTNYFVRAYATNKYGTSYGEEISFTATKSPSVITKAATLIGNTTATLNANINAQSFSTTVTFEYGTSTSYGSSVSATTSPVTGITATDVHANVTLLNPGTTYHFRVKAESTGGTTYGEDLTFTTLQPPSATTDAATNVTTTSATINGTVNANNSSTSVSFEYGPTSDYGSSIAGTPSAITGNTSTNVTAALTGLITGTIYHYRARAISDGGAITGSDMTFKTSVITETVSDIDGNTYNTVTIGTQVWMAENLKTTKYRDGTSIQNVTDNNTWNNLTSGAYCDYENTPSISATSGRLYNWYTSIDSRNICPTGWHVPTDAEWTVLIDFLTNNGFGYDGSGNDIAKSMASSSGWTTDPTAGNVGNNQTSNNSSGFTALPGGFRWRDNGLFYYKDNLAGWWSSSETSNLSAYCNSFYSYSNSLSRDGAVYKQNGYSIRCLKGEGLVLPAVITTSATTITSSGASSGGNITSDGGASITSKGVCWSTNPNPTVSDSKTSEGTGIGSFTSSITGLTSRTTYHIRAYATNSVGTSYGNDVTFITSSTTVTDIDGNIYNTVVIGTQTWMTENLKTTKYRDGSSISNVTDNTAWLNLVTGGYCWYNNDEATYKAISGAIYNFHTTIDNRQLCPIGWHVPTSVEWTTLTDYLTNNGYGYEGSGNDIAKSLATNTGWAADPSLGVVGNDQGSNNSSGFSAPPSGYRDHITASFYGNGYYGHWWSSTNANGWHLSYNGLVINNSTFSRQYGNSVRCIKGEGQVLPAITTTAATSITSTGALSGGNITSDGGASITAKGVCWSTNPNPTISDSKTSDGTVTGAFTSNITGLTSNTTYHIRAYATNSVGTAYGEDLSFNTSAPLTVVDYDGNIYNTVILGSQQWFQSDLKTTKYNNGDDITLITDNSTWAGIPTEAYCWYNNDIGKKDTYGALYNWYASVDIRNVCPTGWHLPSWQEFKTLSDFLGGFSNAGLKMKASGTIESATGLWYSPNLYATNESNFNGIPGGHRDLSGAFVSQGYYSRYWTTTKGDQYAAHHFVLGYDVGTLGNSYWDFKHGFSIRCIKGELALAETAAASAVASTSTTLNGKVNPNGASTNVVFEFGETTSYGSLITISQSPVSGSVPINLSVILSGLTPGTTYHFRVKAVNSGGTSYGNDMTFTTPAQLTDYESNIYNAVIIGDQTWMQENLKSTKYSDGTSISGFWAYGNDIGNVPVYGYLYNWYAVMNGAPGSILNPSGVQGVCPTGWHVPSATEWDELSTFLGADQGGKMKEAGFLHWSEPNTGATNESGFSGLPGGALMNNPSLGFMSFGSWAGFWTSTFVNDMVECTAKALYNNNTGLGGGNVGKANGYSMRCVKD